MKHLPIGQQSFSNLVQDDCVYIDKTPYIYSLMNSGSRYYFLSRPRRFGKSLLLSTIGAVFEGRKELFEELFIYDKIDWVKQPVVLLDMSKNAKTVASLTESLLVILKGIAADHAIALDYDDPAIVFSELLRLLYKKTGQQIILLVDEYDKPILDAMGNLPLATEIRALLQTFYTVIKSSGAYLRFVLLTGVSKISQTSIFSGLNNLKDITFSDDYAGICGYTQQELEQGFGGYIAALTQRYGSTYANMLLQIKEWYNGYSWNGQIFVYNPFSALLLFDEKTFAAHWFNTGTPSFLLQLLKNKNDFSALLQPEIEVNIDFANRQTLEKLDIVPLCFQTGYLTIKKYDFKTGTYWLQIPNKEVRIALTESILTDFTNQSDYTVNALLKNVRDGFANGNTAEAMYNLRILFSQISYNTHIPSESHYHAMFQLAMNLAGIQQQPESYTSKGRMDSLLQFENRVYIIEIKYAANPDQLDATLEKAMTQIKQTKYYEPFLNQGKIIHLLALVFLKGSIGYDESMLESR